jgi:DNA-binding NarL/FixJ family response regulator
VVVLTTSGDDRDVTECYELGASTYIQKPVDFAGLIGAVSRIKDYWFGVALLPEA